MKNAFLMLTVYIVCMTGCTSTPGVQRKESFEVLKARLEKIEMVDGKMTDYKAFYGICEQLSNIFIGSEYGRDLVKDMLLTGTTIPVRMAGAVVLERIAIREDAYVLINALDDYSVEVTDQVHRSLIKITKEDFGKDKSKWLKWWKKEKAKKEAENDK